MSRVGATGIARLHVPLAGRYHYIEFRVGCTGLHGWRSWVDNGVNTLRERVGAWARGGAWVRAGVDLRVLYG